MVCGETEFKLGRAKPNECDHSVWLGLLMKITITVVVPHTRSISSLQTVPAWAWGYGRRWRTLTELVCLPHSVDNINSNNRGFHHLELCCVYVYAASPRMHTPLLIGSLLCFILLSDSLSDFRLIELIVHSYSLLPSIYVPYYYFHIFKKT